MISASNFSVGANAIHINHGIFKKHIVKWKDEKINAEANAFTKAKKPVPAHVSAELKLSGAALAKIDRKIAERQQAIDTIRQRFEQDKKRYLYLRGMNQSQ